MHARWHATCHATSDLRKLQQMILFSRNCLWWYSVGGPEYLYPYFDMRDELTIEDKLEFKGHQLVVPASLRRELKAVTHASHIGVEACIRRARDCLYWPLMSKEMKEYVARCHVCMVYRNEQRKEPIQQHEFVGRPWSKVAVDLCDLDKRTLLVISDYFSNYIDVERVQSVTTRSIIKELKAGFEWIGISDTLVTDNGLQFASEEVAVFARTWEFDQVTSSPRSNGKAENAVKTVKSIFKKCKESGRSEFLALLDWRNMPTEGLGTSPAQRLMGRHCKTLLLIAISLLKPRYVTEVEMRAFAGMKQHQKLYYNKGAKPLEAILPGETVQMKLPGRDTLSPGTCTSKLADRSYMVKVDDMEYCWFSHGVTKIETTKLLTLLRLISWCIRAA